MSKTRPQSITGSLSQMSAALTHRVGPDQLRRINDSIPKVMIVTGDDDNLVLPSNSDYLHSHMPNAELVKWDGTGHALHTQWPDRYYQLLQRTFREGRQRMSSEPSR